jgi:hypothetical protein
MLEQKCMYLTEMHVPDDIFELWFTLGAVAGRIDAAHLDGQRCLARLDQEGRAISRFNFA